MNQYTEVLLYLKELAERFGAKTVTKNLSNETDLQEQNIYPLVNLVIDNGSFTNGQTIVFNLIIEALTIRDINTEVVNDKFFSNDNEVDNHNEMLSILNQMWTLMYRDFESRNIQASENPTFDKFSYEGVNLLDGWALSFTIELPNDTLNLCQ